MAIKRAAHRLNAPLLSLVSGIGRLALLGGMVGSGGMAHTGQSHSPRWPDAVVAQTPPNVIGQSYPNFGPPQTPIVSDRFKSAVVGESYPRLIPPTTAGGPATMPGARAGSNSIVRDSRNFQPRMGD